MFINILKYLYHQTGAEFLESNNFKSFCKKLTDEEIECEGDEFEIKIDKKVI